MNYLPDGVERMDNMRWVFGESPSLAADFVDKNMLVGDSA
jgi:hypothetical protein